MGVGNLTGSNAAKRARKAAQYLQRMQEYQKYASLANEFRSGYGAVSAALPATGAGDESSGYSQSKGGMISTINANLQMARLAGDTYNQMRKDAAKAKKKQGQFKAGIAVASMVTMGAAAAMAPAAGAALAAAPQGGAGTGLAGGVGATLAAPAAQGAASVAASNFAASTAIAPVWSRAIEGAYQGFQLGTQFNEVYSGFFDNNREFYE